MRIHRFALIMAWICDICIWKTREIKYYVLPVRCAVPTIIYWFTTNFHFRSPSSLVLATHTGTWHNCQRCPEGANGACIFYILNWLGAIVIFHFDLFMQKIFFFLGTTYFTSSISICFFDKGRLTCSCHKGGLILFVQGILLCCRNMPSFFQARHLH